MTETNQRAPSDVRRYTFLAFLCHGCTMQPRTQAGGSGMPGPASSKTVSISFRGGRPRTAAPLACARVSFSWG